VVVLQRFFILLLFAEHNGFIMQVSFYVISHYFYITLFYMVKFDINTVITNYINVFMCFLSCQIQYYVFYLNVCKHTLRCDYGVFTFVK
jgi:hypothetical protein